MRQTIWRHFVVGFWAFLTLIGMALQMACDPVLAQAQVRGIGRLVGTALDTTGRPLPEAVMITVKQVEADDHREPSRSNADISTTVGTDENGKWVVTGLTRGKFILVFRLKGYVSVAVAVTLLAEIHKLKPIDITMRKAQS